MRKLHFTEARALGARVITQCSLGTSSQEYNSSELAGSAVRILVQSILYSFKCGKHMYVGSYNLPQFELSPIRSYAVIDRNSVYIGAEQLTTGYEQTR